MARRKKSWTEKLVDHNKPASITVLEKPFGGFLPGAKVLLSTPADVKKYMDEIPPGETRSVVSLRQALAKPHGADGTCPLTTGIFCRIVSEAALEDHAAGMPANAITPFWRVIEPDSALAKKISCGPGFIEEMRAIEA